MQLNARCNRYGHRMPCTDGGYRRLPTNIHVTVITAMLLFFSIGAYAQKITYAGKNVPLEKTFPVIKVQTGYLVVYSSGLLKDAKKITVNASNMPLQTFLDKIFEQQPLKYVIKQNTILLTPKTQSAGVPEKEAAIREEMDRAQEQVITGIVTNEQGMPIPGATLRRKGGTNGAVTGEDGAFRLNAGKGDIVLVQMMGFRMQEIAIGGQSTLKISLQPEAVNLENVTISTGYKKIPKYQLTGAASVITEKEYDQRVAVTGNFLESLEGKVPGLVYNSQTGELSIRGVSTFDAVKRPLIVVDGFPTEIDLNTINPIDIVSISVLRDAAAASIYGVRASNGVIVVETRRGQAGKARFNFRATTAMQAAPDFGYLRYAGAGEFAGLQEAQFRRSNPSESSYTTTGGPPAPVFQILFDEKANRITPAIARQRLDSIAGYDNRRDYENLFYRSRAAHNLNLDVSGGGEKSTYLFGVNYIGEKREGMNAKNDQLMLNLANTFQLSPRIRMDFRSTYAHAASGQGVIPSLTDFYPYERLTDDHGNPVSVVQGPNRDYLSTGTSKARNDRLIAAGLYDQLYYPYRQLTANTTDIKTNSVKVQARLEGKIASWLTAEVGGNYEYLQGVSKNLLLESAYEVRQLLNMKATKDASGRPQFIDVPQGNILRKTDQNAMNYTLRGQLNADKRFGDHEITGMLGAEQRRTTADATLASFFGYDGQTLLSKPVNLQRASLSTRPAFTDANMYGSGMNLTNYFNETSSDRRFMSYYAQATYIYKSKYIATGSYRIDQSNLFGVDPKYKYRPLWSTGLAWRLHMEDFLKDKTWISELKLNATTGLNGNVPLSNNGPFLILQSQLNNLFDVSQPAYFVLTPENQSLRWETTRSYNFRLDYGFFNNRLYGSVDYYVKRTNDVFGQYDADPTTGFNQYNANTATIRNSGVDLLISSVNARSRKFEWRTSLTASLNHNKVLAVKATEYDNSQSITSNRINRKDYPMDALFSYNYGGLNNMGKPFVNDRKGGQHILNFYGAAVVDVTFDDLIYNGTVTPKYVLGLNNQFTVGAFDLSFLFMYYGGHVMRVEQPSPDNLGSYATPLLEGSANYWKQPGDELVTQIPGFTPGRAADPYYFSSYARYGYKYASQFVRRADYIRLRDVVLTWNANFAFMKKAGFSRTQLRLQGQNMFKYTFSGNDIDPEAIDRVSGRRRLEVQPLYSLSLFTNF
ncbi:SusC/RagA family TonB-linked outer membrane protein [Chitinophaga caseinilytica]|uniref:SusC/RagA family TonB-linked outer membrane protein n=1 Tax=Chitinophaga caseinilytica TaxID=2267521 RepID=UPI003C2C75C7